VTWLLLLLGCSAEPQATAPPEAMPAVANLTTFATMASLGPHRLESRTTTTITRPELADQVREESFSLRWLDDSRWQAIRRRDGETVEELRIWENRVWRAAGGGPLQLRGDAEPYRSALHAEWDPWRSALGLWSEQVEFRELPSEEIEGRRALVYTLQPRAPLGDERKANRMLGVEGRVWIDEATAVRLVGDVTLRTQSRDKIEQVHLRYSVTEIGGEPGVEPPPTATGAP
jgi:hypothetical protein